MIDTGKGDISEKRSKEKRSVVFHPDISVVHVYEGYDSSSKESDGRQEWTKPRDFLVALISLTAGLGNIYRLPFSIYRYGGGAFLIPYFIMLNFVGRPIYFLELAMGQFTSSGQVKVWSMAPILRGVGYGSMIGSITVVTYYAGAVALLLFLFFSSFQAKLPWTVCDDEWVRPGDMWGMDADNGTYGIELECNETDLTKAFEVVSGDMSEISLTQLFFENSVLKQKDHINEGIGSPDWKLGLCLLLAWFLIWRVLRGGTKAIGKIAYVTATVPYVLLLVLFIRAITLPNAMEGILHLLRPDWSKLYEAKVWFAALSQCLFSLNAGFGPMIMLGSYNRFDRNIYRDTWIVSGIDTLVGLLAGVTIFAFLGNLAGILDVEIEKVTLTENNFAIILFAQGVSTFEAVPQLFSIIFFLMLALIGIGTAAAYVGAVIAVISDQFPQAVRYRAISFVCVVGLAIGLLYVTPGGSIMTRLADYFGAKVVVCVMALIEVVGVAWIYGIEHFLTDIEFMLKIRLGWYWKFCWCYFIPISIIGILFYAFIDGDHSPLYKGTNFSGMTLSFGWMFSLLAISAVPISAYYVLKSSKATGFLEKMRDVTNPSEDWGPQRWDLRREWNEFKKSKRPEPEC